MAEKQTAQSKQVCQYTNLVNILTVLFRYISAPDITVNFDGHCGCPINPCGLRRDPEWLGNTPDLQNKPSKYHRAPEINDFVSINRYPLDGSPGGAACRFVQESPLSANSKEASYAKSDRTCPPVCSPPSRPIRRHCNRIRPHRLIDCRCRNCCDAGAG